VIQQNMSRIVAGRSVIVIAHRLSALRMCTRIIGLEKGEIVEDGTPEVLMRGRGRLAALRNDKPSCLVAQKTGRQSKRLGWRTAGVMNVGK
jgi:ABC-type transport system involved in cytochrome bd biosynthesis fused ATPase/permease subunit